MARIISLVVLVTILAVIGALLFHVLAGFVLPVFLAVLLVVMFSPVHRWFDARCRGRARLSAALTTAAILVIVLVPLALLLTRAVRESVVVYRRLDPRTIDIRKVVEPAVKWYDKQMNQNLTVDDLQKGVIGRVQQWLAPVALGTTQIVGEFLLDLLVMVFALYYFLADGPEMVQSLVRLLPLDQRYSVQLVDQFIAVSRAVVVATLLSAIIQGLLAGIALYLAGFSSVFLLTVLAILMAMVPFVGPPIIWIPACLWLYFYEDRAAAAVAMAIFGAAGGLDGRQHRQAAGAPRPLEAAPPAGPAERFRRHAGPRPDRHFHRSHGRRLPANPVEHAARRVDGDAGRPDAQME